MKNPDTEELIKQIVARDPRYAIDAYDFIRHALDYTVQKSDNPRHVSGQELLEGIREFALQQFGPMTKTTLDQWGVQRTEDIGEIVFNMVETGVLGRTDEDSRADFANGYDFDETFRRPFQPCGQAHR